MERRQILAVATSVVLLVPPVTVAPVTTAASDVVATPEPVEIETIYGDDDGDDEIDDDARDEDD